MATLDTRQRIHSAALPQRRSLESRRAAVARHTPFVIRGALYAALTATGLPVRTLTANRLSLPRYAGVHFLPGLKAGVSTENVL
ncbi:hypothetical protein EDD27_2646 [Nonomuraea polychroma]|uniref:Uncharacterized protein n=1 Tax=Nonomuraea polychroma TaxID=46176 RepID=A0A438M334_9ACTN|nr:hypothetical protein EDD27_2646 [Nonomuraea polychroma]